MSLKRDGFGAFFIVGLLPISGKTRSRQQITFIKSKCYKLFFVIWFNKTEMSFVFMGITKIRAISGVRDKYIKNCRVFVTNLTKQEFQKQIIEFLRAIKLSAKFTFINFFQPFLLCKSGISHARQASEISDWL